MKAIYINIDPYLQAVADWLNAGATGTAPKFDPLPVAVTIPAGQTACIYLPATGDSAESEPDYNSTTIDGQTVQFMFSNSGAFPDGTIAYGETPGLSALAPSAKYAVLPVAGDTSLTVLLSDGDTYDGSVTVPVLVQFEKASGVVDLVDFAPPAAAPTLTAAAINEALGGTGAAEGQPLKGVSLTSATDAPAPTADAINRALGGPGASGEFALYGVNIANTNWINGIDNNALVTTGSDASATVVALCGEPHA